jgi:hypothetical protein
MLRLVETSINNSFSVALYKRSGTNETHLLTGGAGSGTNTESTFIAVTGTNTNGAGSLYINKANTNIGYGVTGGGGARLDVKAQGALSTDIAFRVRNSADTFDLLSINGVGLISGRTDGAGGFNMNYQGTANTTVQLAFNNGNPTLRVAQNTGGHAFNVYTSTDNREYLAGLIGKATFAIGANPLAGTIKPNEANTNTMYVFNGTAPTLSATDSFNLYSADITAGNAAPHFRTENGSIIKLYQQSAVTSSQGLADVLTNVGLLSGSSVIAPTFPYTGSAEITGSLTVTGSVAGAVQTLSIVSSTASLDLSQGNFFELTLSSSTTTYLEPINIQPGQTINLKINQPATSGSLTYDSTLKFPGGIPYSASATGSVTDIVSLISFDSTTLYATAIKNLS